MGLLECLVGRTVDGLLDWPLEGGGNSGWCTLVDDPVRLRGTSILHLAGVSTSEEWVSSGRVDESWDT